MRLPQLPGKHFSMLCEFHLADFFTLGNAARGGGAIFFTMLFMESRMRLYFYTVAGIGSR